jgi:uncharacterized membrane protein YccC
LYEEFFVKTLDLKINAMLLARSNSDEPIDDPELTRQQERRIKKLADQVKYAEGYRNAMRQKVDKLMREEQKHSDGSPERTIVSRKLTLALAQLIYRRRYLNALQNNVCRSNSCT